ncbi:amino acid adenylation domain-containing protein, partial [Viridibacillus arvi]
ILLSKYSGQEEIVVGTPIAGRTHADLENVMGMFVNTLAFRNEPREEGAYLEFLEEVKENCLKAYENQNYQFEELVEKLNLRRDTSRNPLFDIMFNMVDTETSRDIQLDGLLLNPYYNGTKISKFDLTLNASEEGSKLQFSIEYCSKLFKKETIDKLSNHFIKLLEDISTNYEMKITEFELITIREKDQILYEFNNTNAAYPKDKTVKELFEEQVERTPNSVAIVFGEKQVTYRELNEKANQLARLLRSKGVKADEIVGIMLDRSVEMIIGIMGVIKAGGAYLPIDPTHPNERIEYMLEDSQSKVLLTQNRIVGNLGFNSEIIDLYNDDLFKGASSNLSKVTRANDLVYVIYTSGTTGNPKGVMIENKGLTNYVWWANKMYLKDDEETIAFYSSVSFDLTVTSLFPPLISGNRIVIYGNDESEFILFKILRENVTTVLKLTPAHLTLLKDMDNSNSKIKRLIIGGEDLKENLAEKIYKNFNKNVEIYNEYGPTESVVGCTVYKYDDKYNGVSVPIGCPGDNVQIHILDKHLNVVPTGLVGELFISGDGLARGYLNKPELTAEKFVYNPFEPSKKMYKTGDLARWLPDGNIEYLGRVDHQVKIRGFRIELGEIEGRLLQHEEVKEVAVVARENKEKEKYICAYVVSGKDIGELNLKSYLKGSLPEYMVPSYFVQLAKMPLTTNGKLNRRALPEPEIQAYAQEYEAPRNEIEKKLVDIWSEVLGVEQVGINDNFFELGGHSLKAMTLLLKINKEFNTQFSIKHTFTLPTIKDFVSAMESFEESAIKSHSENAVLLKKADKIQDEDEVNLFIVHDGSGDVGAYFQLTSRIGKNINCWGIKADNRNTYNLDYLSIEQLAEKYIRVIKDIQPKGSYNIAGWSLGGIIAFEIVRQLENNNEEIGNLVLLDSYIKSVELHDTVLQDNFTVEKEKTQILNYIEDIEIYEEISNKTDVEEVWTTTVEYMKQKDINLIKSNLPTEFTSIIPNFADINISELIYAINTNRTLNRAANLYRPHSKVKKQAFLYKAEENIDRIEDNWNNYFEKQVIVNKTSGDHYTMIKSENAKSVAMELEKIF